MTVDKQQQCDGARHMSRDEREPRKKNEEQGGEISHFFLSRILQGKQVDALRHHQAYFTYLLFVQCSY